MHRTLRLALVLLAVAAAGFLGVRQWRSHARTVRFEEALVAGSRLETDGEPARAAQHYEEMLALELTDAERAQVRYRLASALIDADGLNRALGVLDELTTEDVARFSIDAGPLYLRLGDRALAQGRRDLARLAWRLGQAVSPQRIEEFGRRREQLIRPPDGANAAEGDG